jgi:hypothetical protein
LIPRAISSLSKSSSSSLTVLDKSNLSGTPEKAGGAPAGAPGAISTSAKVVKSLSLPHSENVRSSLESESQQQQNFLLASTATTGIGSTETVSSSPSTIGIDAIVGRPRAGSDITVEIQK